MSIQFLNPLRLSRRRLLAAGGAGLALGAAAQPHATGGRLERLPDIASRHVEPRHVDVWLPPGYRADRPHQVLYMHDGQMLFDAASTWNGQAWDVHLALQRLQRAGHVADTIVVGVWNVPRTRYADYYPQKMLTWVPQPLRGEYVSRAMDGQPRADAYLRFLVEELKPAIDRRYATRTGPESTAVMGSSMGGLISLYALCEHPRVFGAAAALSTHWVGLPTAWGPERLRNAALPSAALQYLAQALPAPGAHRLYMDRGTVGLEALYAAAQSRVDELVRERGYGEADAMSRVFEGAGHDERSWAARLDLPLRFTLAPR